MSRNTNVPHHILPLNFSDRPFPWKSGPGAGQGSPDLLLSHAHFHLCNSCSRPESLRKRLSCLGGPAPLTPILGCFPLNRGGKTHYSIILVLSFDRAQGIEKHKHLGSTWEGPDEGKPTTGTMLTRPPSLLPGHCSALLPASAHILCSLSSAQLLS